MVSGTDGVVKFEDGYVGRRYEMDRLFKTQHQRALTHLAASLWSTMWTFVDGKNGDQVKIGMRKLAEFLGTHHQSVQRAMNVLVDRGYVEILLPGVPGRDGRCAVYALHLPELKRAGDDKRQRHVAVSGHVADKSRTSHGQETATWRSTNGNMANGNGNMAHDKRQRHVDTSVLDQSSSELISGCSEASSEHAASGHQESHDPKPKTKGTPGDEEGDVGDPVNDHEALLDLLSAKGLEWVSLVRLINERFATSYGIMSKWPTFEEAHRRLVVSRLEQIQE